MESGSVVGVACVHATKLNLTMTTIVVTRPVDLPPIWEDMSKSTLDAKFAVSLKTMSMWSAYPQGKVFTSQHSSNLPSKSICKAHYL